MGPVITRQHKEKVLGYIEKGMSEGAKLLLDGRGYQDREESRRLLPRARRSSTR